MLFTQDSGFRREQLRGKIKNGPPSPRNRAHDVVATPGLDLVFIGPGDLATSMGLKGRADHPHVQVAMKTLEFHVGA
jgi:hypothetical protein